MTEHGFAIAGVLCLGIGFALVAVGIAYRVYEFVERKLAWRDRKWRIEVELAELHQRVEALEGSESE